MFHKTEECSNQASEVVNVDQGLNTGNIMKVPTQKRKKENKKEKKEESEGGKE